MAKFKYGDVIRANNYSVAVVTANGGGDNVLTDDWYPVSEENWTKIGVVVFDPVIQVGAKVRFRGGHAGYTVQSMVTGADDRVVIRLHEDTQGTPRLHESEFYVARKDNLVVIP